MNSNNNDQKTLCNMLECDIDCTQDFYAYNIPIVKFDYNHFNLKCFISVLNIALIFLFNSCMTREQDDRNQPTDPISDSVVHTPITYNFYIENSGSMKGYFANNDYNIKTIITEYYDRISEKNTTELDTITLNYINATIEKSNLDIKTFVNTTRNHCTAAYTKIDDILAIAMDSLKDNQVNIIISDFCFSSDYSNIAIAQSGITRLFTTRLNKDKDMAIAIFKYDCDFNGKYYPGGLSCSHRLPIYIWAFGSNLQIKEIARLPIKELHEEMIIQQHQYLIPEFEVKNGRMLDKNDNSIIVSKWSTERNSNDYILKFKVDMSSISLGETYLVDINKYVVNGDYVINRIEKDPNTEIYTYSIITNHPSPGVVKISLINSIPSWVDKSNFDGDGVPNEGQTLGIKPLIEGVYDAYNNKNSKYLTININIK